MRPVRKIALVVVSVVVVLIAILATIPLFFGGKITARLKAEVARSVNARVEWSGVGLSLVRQIAVAHNGSVGIGETPGGGATVTLRL